MFILSLIFTLLLAGTAIAQEKISVNFNELNHLLETRSQKIQAALLEKEAADLRQGNLWRSFLPKLMVYGRLENYKIESRDWREQPASGAEISLNLFNGSRDWLESEYRTIDYQAKSNEALRINAEELQSLRQLYWEIVYTQEKIVLLESMLKINGQNLNAAARRIRSGVATSSDRIEFEMKDVDLKRDLSASKLKMDALKRNFRVMTDLDEKTHLIFPTNLDHDHDFISNLKIDTKAYDFLIKEVELESRKKDVLAKKSSRGWWPSVEAFAAHNTFKERPESETEIVSDQTKSETLYGLKMTVDLFSGLNSHREGAALSKESAAARKLANLKRKEIGVDALNEIEDLKFQHSQIHDAESNIERAEKYYKLTQSEYSRGVKNSPDVLGASERYFDNQLKRLEIIRDFQLAKAHVFFKLGQ